MFGVTFIRTTLFSCIFCLVLAGNFISQYKTVERDRPEVIGKFSYEDYYDYDEELVFKDDDVTEDNEVFPERNTINYQEREHINFGNRPFLTKVSNYRRNISDSDDESEKNTTGADEDVFKVEKLRINYTRLGKQAPVLFLDMRRSTFLTDESKIRDHKSNPFPLTDFMTSEVLQVPKNESNGTSVVEPFNASKSEENSFRGASEFDKFSDEGHLNTRNFETETSSARPLLTTLETDTLETRLYRFKRERIKKCQCCKRKSSTEAPKDRGVKRKKSSGNVNAEKDNELSANSKKKKQGCQLQTTPDNDIDDGQGINLSGDTTTPESPCGGEETEKPDEPTTKNPCGTSDYGETDEPNETTTENPCGGGDYDETDEPDETTTESPSDSTEGGDQTTNTLEPESWEAILKPDKTIKKMYEHLDKVRKQKNDFWYYGKNVCAEEVFEPGGKGKDPFLPEDSSQSIVRQKCVGNKKKVICKGIAHPKDGTPIKRYRKYFCCNGKIAGKKGCKKKEGENKG